MIQLSDTEIEEIQSRVLKRDNYLSIDNEGGYLTLSEVLRDAKLLTRGELREAALDGIADFFADNAPYLRQRIDKHLEAVRKALK